MPQITPTLGMTTYDLVNDGGVYFSTFRTTLAGYTNSALTKIDAFATQTLADINLLKSNPPIVRIPAIKTDDFSYAVTGITEITEYRNGMYINLSLDNTNLGTISLNINNLGSKGVYKIGTDGLVANMSAGDLKLNKMYLFRYNGTAWVWVNAVTSDQLNVVGTVGNLTKISTNNTLEDAGVTFSNTTTNNALAQRTASGQIKGVTPVDNDDLVNKTYVDNKTTLATVTSTLINGGIGMIGASTKVAREDHTHTMPTSVLQSQVINDLTTGGETKVLSAQQGVVINNVLSKFSFQAHSPYRAWQGVSTDGNFIYVTSDRDANFNLQNIISVYDMKGNFVKEKLNAYTTTDPQGKFMSFGDCTIIDGKLFATVYNINSGGNPLVSRVVEFSLVDLSIITAHEIGAGVAECVVKKDNEYWISYHDVQQVKKFNSSFLLLETYSLSQPASSQGGYQGMFWKESDLYLNMHGANSHGGEDVGTLDRYYFNGTNFTFIESIKPPTFGATQGVCYFGDRIYWNDRASNEIIITNSIKTNTFQPLLTPITNNYIFKPTLLNGWTNFDNINDRTLKAWKDPFGVVHLEGLITGGTSVTTCAILPEGYRPKYGRNFAVDADSAFGRVSINSAGAIIPFISATSGYVSFDGITFLANPTL